MLRINKLTDYGVMLLAEMAAEPERKFTPMTLAKTLELPKPTVTKLLKQMAGAGLLASSRGKNGGYRLKIAPEELSIAAVLTVLEGPLALTECSLGPGVCRIEKQCRIGKGWQQINHALYSSLEQLSLAALAKPVQSGKSDRKAALN